MWCIFVDGSAGGRKREDGEGGMIGEKPLLSDSCVLNSRVGLILALSILGLFFCFSLWIVFFPERKDYENQVRSSSLRQITTENGDVTDIVYVNADGIPTVAANVGYATVRRTKRRDGVLEEYFDENGKKVRLASGGYALLREYDDQQREYKITWLDENGEPCISVAGYAMRIRNFDTDGRFDTELYFDVAGEQIETLYYAYGCRYSYDVLGRINLITYLDLAGNPVMTGQGFASIQRSFFTEEGMTWRVERDCFFDEKGAPISSANGTFGRKFTYDEFGRTETLTSLDKQGIPFINKDGFSTVKYTYYEDDSVKTEMYYDTEGNPLAPVPGKYGVLHEEDRVTYLNYDGSERFSFRNLLFNQPVIAMLAAVLAILVSLIFGRKINFFLLVICFGAIVFMTLMNRSMGANRAPLELFYFYKQFFNSYPARKEILDNIWLFVPLGTVLYRLFPKGWIWIILLGVSVAIEVIQYVTGLGSAELDDVISNGLGGVIGVIVAMMACELGRQFTERRTNGKERENDSDEFENKALGNQN